MSSQFITLLELVNEANFEAWGIERITIQAGSSQSGITRESPNMIVKDFLPYPELKHQVANSDLIIAHAGVGILSDCLSENKRPILIPRTRALGEHNDDHQMDFVKEFEADGLFLGAYSTSEIAAYIISKAFLEPPSRKEISRDPHWLDKVCERIYELL